MAVNLSSYSVFECPGSRHRRSVSRASALGTGFQDMSDRDLGFVFQCVSGNLCIVFNVQRQGSRRRISVSSVRDLGILFLR